MGGRSGDGGCVGIVCEVGQVEDVGLETMLGAIQSVVLLTKIFPFPQLPQPLSCSLVLHPSTREPYYFRQVTIVAEKGDK